MGSIAARHARTVLEHTERVIALELLVAAQALDLRLAGAGWPGGGDVPEPGLGVREAHARVRARVTPLDRDREPGPDIAAATELIRVGALVDLVTGAPGGGSPGRAEGRVRVRPPRTGALGPRPSRALGRHPRTG